jgi:hypothetical protein
VAIVEGVDLPCHAEKEPIMDADRFDTLARSLTIAGSRRRVLGLLSGVGLGGLAPLLHLADAEAGKRKKKKKKKKKSTDTPLSTLGPICTPRCGGRRCGGNGCGGTCGTCAECQTCEPTVGLCPMTLGSDTTPCSGGACCGGACCPPSCQCGVSGLTDALARLVAQSQGLPYPACFATGTGQSCGALGGSCPTGTTCKTVEGIGVGVCVGLCPGASYPSI